MCTGMAENLLLTERELPFFGDAGLIRYNLCMYPSSLQQSVVTNMKGLLPVS